MIVLDTHIWVWWVNGSAELSASKSQILASRQADDLGVSVQCKPANRNCVTRQCHHRVRSSGIATQS